LIVAYWSYEPGVDPVAAGTLPRGSRCVAGWWPGGGLCETAPERDRPRIQAGVRMANGGSA